MKIVIRPPGTSNPEDHIVFEPSQVGSVEVYLNDGQRFDFSEQRDGPLDRNGNQTLILRIATLSGILKVFPRAANSVFLSEEL